jgi:hypothetical protein
MTSILFAQSEQVSKVGTTAATFLEIGVGGTAQGMGGAYVSLGRDASSLYWNPSGISLIKDNQAMVYHSEWLADTRFNFAGVIIPIESFGVLGLSFTSLNMGDMAVRTVEMPEGTGEFFSAGDLAIGLSYARNLTDRFSIGVTAKYIQQTIWHSSASAVALDAGTLFKTDLFNGMVIGASISNFGPQLTMSGRDSRMYTRVDVTKQGSDAQIPYNIDMDSWDLPLSIHLGVSTNVVKTEDYHILVAVDAVHPNDNFESLNVGTEFGYKDYISLRAGYQSLFLKDSEGGLTLGVGLNSKMLFSDNEVRFDYAYRDFGRLNAVHSFSVSVSF